MVRTSPYVLICSGGPVYLITIYFFRYYKYYKKYLNKYIYVVGCTLTISPLFHSKNEFRHVVCCSLGWFQLPENQMDHLICNHFSRKVYKSGSKNMVREMVFTWIDWVNLKGILGKTPSVHRTGNKHRAWKICQKE